MNRFDDQLVGVHVMLRASLWTLGVRLWDQPGVKSTKAGWVTTEFSRPERWAHI